MIGSSRRNKEKNSEENRKIRQGYTDTELTREGWLFCIVTGLLETAVTFAVCRIDPAYVPVLVFLVLWTAFGIITAECVIRIRDMNTVIESVVRRGSCQIHEWREVLDMKKAS